MSDEGTEERTGIFEKLEKIPYPLIFTLLFIVTAYPLLYPIGLPIPIEEYTIGYYEAIDSLPSGSLVVVTSDYGGSYVGEMYPQTAATITHLLNSDIKFVAVALKPFGAMMLEKALEDNQAWDRKTYGEDFVTLGFIPGEIVATESFAREVHSLVQKDYYGNDIEDLPLMNELRSAEDIDLLIPIYSEVHLGGGWITQISDPYDVPTVSGLNGANSVTGFSYLQADLIDGLLVGLRGAAEYELLTNKPGAAVAYMDAQALLHISAIILIIIGNIGYLGSRRRK